MNLAEFKENAVSPKIIFPEGDDERIIIAAKLIQEKKIAQPILISEKNIEGIKTINLQIIADDAGEFIEELIKITGFSPEVSQKIVLHPLYFSALALRLGYVDSLIAGCVFTSGEVIAIAKQIIGLKKEITVPSSFFLMDIPNYNGGEEGKLIFADASVNIDPTSEELADIAVATADTAQNIFQWEPRVALLSFSTQGSANHPLVDKVVRAVELAQAKAPQVAFAGELQADAALREDVAKRKMKEIGKVGGKANILIFPDLNAANISYKLINILAKAQALGPILQGFNKPLSDLSRGVKAEEIVNIAFILVGGQKQDDC